MPTSTTGIHAAICGVGSPSARIAPHSSMSTSNGRTPSTSAKLLHEERLVRLTYTKSMPASHSVVAWERATDRMSGNSATASGSAYGASVLRGR